MNQRQMPTIAIFFFLFDTRTIPSLPKNTDCNFAENAEIVEIRERPAFLNGHLC